MAKRSRKRKLEGEDDDEVKWELTNIFSEDLRDEMASMWEIPQIFHFLHMSKKALNIPHLSMYEMERMLAMPRASKQLANIMTCLLSPPLPKGKIRKVPPMPYDFWVNVLTHKVKGWFKVYHSKHGDIVKVLETIGVEPDFWKIFPDSSIIDEKEFHRLNFKERVWIVKTLCDTLMHSRKTVQEELSKQCTDDQLTTILGTDRYGAKYFYFPLFLDNDLRVYRHCIDNAILSTVKPPPRKEGQASVSRADKHGRNKRKRSRWKNGALPRERRRSKKSLEDEVKLSGDSAIGSLISEDTNMSSISACSNNNNNNNNNSNNNNIAIETIERNCSRSSSKTPEESAVSGETHCNNPKSSGYDTNTSSDVKSVNSGEADEPFSGFVPEGENDNSTDVICIIRDILDGLTSKVSELVECDVPTEDTDPLEDDLNAKIEEGEEEEEKKNDVIEKMLDSDNERSSRTDSGSDDLNWTKYCPRKARTLDKETLQKEIMIFSSMLGDLSVSNFELVADSVESLRALAISLLTNELNESRTRSSAVPRCEISLARSMEELVEALKDVEPTLKDSARKARSKLQREWTQFNDGVVEDQDASGDVDHGSNGWILGSQGCPLLSSSDATLQTLSESALSEPSPELPAQRSSSVESDLQDADQRTTALGTAAETTDDRTSNDKCQSERRVKIKVEKEDDDDDDDDGNDENEDHLQDSKKEPETRRVLRRRGISSYTEQLSSSEEEAYELEEWSRLKTFYETPSTSGGTSAVHVAQKAGQTGDESEEKDSDQDWLLPSSRKRKNKRSPSNRRLKSSPQKVQTNNSDSQESTSLNPPPPYIGATTVQSPTKSSKVAKDSNNTEVPLICKVESIHSVLDIKDEGPIFEYNRNVINPSTVDQQPHPPPRQYHTAPIQFPARPRPPLIPTTIPTTTTTTAAMNPQMDTRYFVQGSENYFPPGTTATAAAAAAAAAAAPSYIQYSFPQMGRGTARYPYPPQPQLPPYPRSPNQQNLWHYQKYGPLPPRYPSNILRPGYPTRGVPLQRGAAPARVPGAPPSRHQVPSTTLYGARSATNKSPMSRMPAPRAIAVQNSNFRGTTRPRLPPTTTTTQPVGRRYAPRSSVVQPHGQRLQRPTLPSNKPESNASTTKTTSLILLSDSDDEIEMIVPEKKSGPSTAPVNRPAPTANRGKPLQPGARPRSKPVVTSEITVPKSREMLSPQMIQRMSQGGISITPVKPPASKQLPGDPAQGTKLVVVVNETGSHYALALPNGSKLILTPEQVAQIRASNGGKLVL